MAILMSKGIRFKKDFTQALGRNGRMRCCGVTLNCDDEIMRIFPSTPEI